MMLSGSNRRIQSVHRHSGMAVAGLAADGRQIVARTKSEATNYERPFGCGIILGGYDREGPQLYMVEPSGISYRYFGAAIGKGKQVAKTTVKVLVLQEKRALVNLGEARYSVSPLLDPENISLLLIPLDVSVALLEEAKAAARAAPEEMDAH
ncbi:hypothetical protein SLEP1_g7151 [Rubroshorea leprosula]|uniref:Uncharacterized protein n=1 Tax=Rubroshorea leprosula TaxID=152421 RepID=A0AAV5HXF9_9ROSI|nr:hypothetical protein SLEP1_g7151 [Rubroshorea leprosula]